MKNRRRPSRVCVRASSVARLVGVLALACALALGPSAARAEEASGTGTVLDFTKLAADTRECRLNMSAIRSAVFHYNQEHPAGLAAPVKELVDLGYLDAAPICPTDRSDRYTISIGTAAGGGAIRVAIKCPGPHGVLDADAEVGAEAGPGTPPAGPDPKATVDACVANMDAIRLAVLHDLDERPSGTAVSVVYLISKGYLPEAPKCPATHSDQYTIVIGSSRMGVAKVDVRCPGPHGALSKPRFGK